MTRMLWCLVALLVSLMMPLTGCGKMTMDQAMVQKQQMANFTEFAQANGLSLIMTANAEVDGTVEFRQVVKWSPVTASTTAVFFNSQSASTLHDLLVQGVAKEPKLEDKPTVSP
jgi:hypothetical protein